jgi:hypothetical protein
MTLRIVFATGLLPFVLAIATGPARAEEAPARSIYLGYVHGYSTGGTLARELYRIPVDASKGVDCAYSIRGGKQAILFSIVERASGPMLVVAGLGASEQSYIDLGKLSGLQARFPSKTADGYFYLLSEEKVADPAAYFQATDDALAMSARLARDVSVRPDDRGWWSSASQRPGTVTCVTGMWGW